MQTTWIFFTDNHKSYLRNQDAQKKSGHDFIVVHEPNEDGIRATTGVDHIYIL